MKSQTYFEHISQVSGQFFLIAGSEHFFFSLLHFFSRSMQHALQVFWHLFLTPNFLHLPFCCQTAHFLLLSAQPPGAGVGVGFGGSLSVPTKRSKFGDVALASATSSLVALFSKSVFAMLTVMAGADNEPPNPT